MTDAATQLDAFRQRSFLDSSIWSVYSLLDRVWSSVIARTLLAGCSSILLILAVAWYPSEPLRRTLGSPLWSIAIVIVSFLMALLWGRQNIRIQRLLSGPPLFGKLGGVPARLYETALRAGRHVKVELTRDDEQWLSSLEDVDIMITEDVARQRFMTSIVKTDLTEDAKDQQWQRIWKDEILGLHVDNIAFAEFAHSGTFGYKIAMPALFRAVLLTNILSGIFTLTMLLFLYFYLSHSVTLHTFTQTGVSLSFILAALWHFVFMRPFVEWPTGDFVKSYSKLLGKEAIIKYESQLRPLGNRVVRPINSQIGRGFMAHTLRRTFVYRICDAVAVALLALVLLWIFYGSHYLIDSAAAISERDWYRNYTLGVVGIGALFTVGFYIMVFVLENVKYVVAPVVSGMLAAILPFLIDVALGGEANIGQIKSAITAAVGGIPVAVAAIIALRLKNILES